MSVRLWLTLGASLSLLVACATHQENPNYAYSTTYKGSPAPTSYAQSVPVSYQNSATTTYASSTAPTSGAYSRVDQSCLRKEKNHELIGAGLGGTIGAIAGNKLIGGTTGTIVGAGLGGAAGYGIGDKTVNCDPQNFVMQSEQPIFEQQSVQSPTQSGYVTQENNVVPATQQFVSGDQTRVVYQSPRVEYQAPTDTQFSSISDSGTPGYQVLQSQTVVQPAPIQQIASATQYQATTAVEKRSSSGAQLVDYDYSENVVSASSFGASQYSETRTLGGGSQNAHLVREGDTVYSLARKNCVGVTDIKTLNGLDQNFAIKIGDNLNLPSSKC